MGQRKTIGISCLLCILVVIAACLILYSIHVDKISIDAPALICEQLEIGIDFPAGTERICAWRDSEGMLYFFLPAGSDTCEIRFANLGTDSRLRLDSDIFTAGHSVVHNIEYSRAYELELILSDDAESSELSQVIFLKSEGIPSLFINTVSGSIEAVQADKEVKEEASAALFNADGNREYSGNLEYIKSRGNSTFQVGKKSYQICFSKKAALLDIPEAKKWILLANYYDESYIKNEFFFRFAEKYTTIPSIRGRYVDLYLNGNYVGNYYLCEKVEVGGNRLDITDLDKAMDRVNAQNDYDNSHLYMSEDGKIKATEGLENPADITGGYLLEHTSQEIFLKDVNNGFMTDSGQCYMIVSPSPATVEQAEYICNLFNEMETAIGQEDGVNPETGKHFTEYLDIDSWISKYLMEEVFQDVDARVHSMFFYKDADSVDPHIFSGPMWDYDKSLGSSGNTYYFLNDPNRVGNLGIYVDQLMPHEEIREQVYQRFEHFFKPYVKYLASADVYNFSESIQASVKLDKVRWPHEYGYFADREAIRDYLINFLQQRVEHLQSAWLEGEEFCTVTFLDYSGNVYERYTVKKGENLSDYPVISTPIAIFYGWYTVGDEIPFDSRRPILQDVTYDSYWIDMDILLTNGLNIADMNVSQVDTEALQNMIDQLKELQGQAVMEELVDGAK